MESAQEIVPKWHNELLLLINENVPKIVKCLEIKLTLHPLPVEGFNKGQKGWKYSLALIPLPTH